jgi:hypothetical protein
MVITCRLHRQVACRDDGERDQRRTDHDQAECGGSGSR